jgi:hypothetical protein
MCYHDGILLIGRDMVVVSAACLIGLSETVCQSALFSLSHPFRVHREEAPISVSGNSHVCHTSISSSHLWVLTSFDLLVHGFQYLGTISSFCLALGRRHYLILFPKIRIVYEPGPKHDPPLQKGSQALRNISHMQSKW